MNKEQEAVNDWLEELERDLSLKQKQLKDKEEELEKLNVISETVHTISIGISGNTSRQNYLDFFNVEEVNQRKEELEKEVNEFKYKNDIKYLKHTINHLKNR